MRLWAYLKEKMLPYKDKVAFANSGITYGDLLAYGKDKDKRDIRFCEGESREELALAILKCLAEGDIAVPVSKEYGRNNMIR